MSITNDEVVIRMVGKLSLEFAEMDQLKIRRIVEEVLYKYDVAPKETAITTSNDTEDKIIIYLAVRKLEGLVKGTLDNYKNNLLNFSSYLRKPLATITTMDIRMYLAQRCVNLRPSSKNLHIFILKAFFGWLYDEEYIPRDPTKRLKLNKEPVRIRQPLTEMQLELFRQSCISDREKALTEFLYSSACRLNDVVTLNISEMNFQECTAVVIGKGNKERMIYFSIKAKVLLQKYFKTRKGESDALFITIKSPYNRLGKRSVERIINNIMVRSKLTVNVFPHILRHTKASDLSNAGTSIQIIKEILGHENISTTTIYAKVSKENIMHEYRRTS